MKGSDGMSKLISQNTNSEADTYTHGLVKGIALHILHMKTSI